MTARPIYPPPVAIPRSSVAWAVAGGVCLWLSGLIVGVAL